MIAALFCLFSLQLQRQVQQLAEELAASDAQRQEAQSTAEAAVAELAASQVRGRATIAVIIICHGNIRESRMRALPFAQARTVGH